MKRSSPAAVRSDVDVRATRFPFITRMPTDRWPASSTSSVSPIRTLTDSSEPDCAKTSATSSAAAAGPVDQFGSQIEERVDGVIGH